MLVHLHQYREDDAKETVRSEGDVDPDFESDSYFAVDELEADEGWERVTFDDRTLLRRAVSYDGVTAVSVPNPTPDTHSELPGDDIQLRSGGDTEYVDSVRIVEVIDESP